MVPEGFTLVDLFFLKKKLPRVRTIATLYWTPGEILKCSLKFHRDVENVMFFYILFLLIFYACLRYFCFSSIISNLFIFAPGAWVPFATSLAWPCPGYRFASKVDPGMKSLKKGILTENPSNLIDYFPR